MKYGGTVLVSCVLVFLHKAEESFCFQARGDPLSGGYKTPLAVDRVQVLWFG